MRPVPCEIGHHAIARDRAVTRGQGNGNSLMIALAEVFQTIGSGDHEAVSIALPTGNGTVAGSGMMTNLAWNRSHDGIVEYTATIMSTGSWTYTASV